MSAEDVLKSFHSDPVSLENILATGDAGYMGRAAAFIQVLNRHGIARSHIDVEDFAVFRHEGLAGAIEQFLRDSPLDALPLERITVNQYVAPDTCRDDLALIRRQLGGHQARMAHYATRFNIDIHVRLFVRGLDAEQAAAIAGFAGTGAVDSIGFFLDFARCEPGSAPALRAALRELCAHAAVRNPKVSFGNFPFCFLPAEHFKCLYRDALGALKGQIGAQRSLLRELRAREQACHAPCRECRCRTPCYAYTQMGEFPEWAPQAVPRRERTLAFAGGSLAPAERPAGGDIVWAAPAAQGDLLAAVLEGFENLLIIDGYFYSRFPCTTFEVMLALEEGVNVFGAASIGALRAAELDRYGMVGVGYVYEYLGQRAVKPYHVVAQTYDEADRPLTLPLIQVIYLLECARREGVVDEAAQEALGALAEEIHFTVLSFEHFFRRAGAEPRLASAAQRLEAYYRDRGRAYFDIKRRDALLLLDRYQAILAGRPGNFVLQAMDKARTGYLGAIGARYPAGRDLALPKQWMAPAAGRGPLPPIARDSRDVPAERTCDRALRFFHGLDVVVADTTRYDPGGSYILSTFFLPFYFLDYYPSSATGNGSALPEALASAYMELVERLSACAVHVEGQKEGARDAPQFPLELIPQLYNWGADAAEKQQAVETYGRVLVTDISAGRDVRIPALAIPFRYSGTDGYAAGNSLPEAILYGVYEVIERDTCQIHHLDPVCRKALPQFQVDKARITDPRCRALMAQAEEKGCDLALFSLPNLSGLPCVMCHVYDRNRRIQCHGGIAVRADFNAALHAALHEAYMQYITYFVGTRDDYTSHAPTKRARVAYENAQQLFLDGPAACPALPAPVRFESVGAELAHVLAKVKGSGAEHVLVANLSPRDEYEVKCVKVIIPTCELWFCPQYRPSSFLPERARRTRAAFQ